MLYYWLDYGMFSNACVKETNMSTVLAILYTILWASAAVATKIGLHSAPPLVLASTRFTAAGVILLGISTFRRSSLPPRNEWIALGILGVLNTTIYLGASFIALSVVSAGLFNLFVAINPLLVMVLDQFWFKHPLPTNKWWGFIVALVGLTIGSWQSLTQGHSPIWGITLIVGGQVAMAIGSVYFQTITLTVSGMVLNAWQLLIGAALLWPVALVTEPTRSVIFNGDWWGALLWLVGCVSIGAMLLWFRLLRSGASQASLWLMLTPIVGYGLGWLILGERVGWRGVIASFFVISGVGIANGYVRVVRARDRSAAS